MSFLVNNSFRIFDMFIYFRLHIFCVVYINSAKNFPKRNKTLKMFDFEKYFVFLFLNALTLTNLKCISMTELSLNLHLLLIFY